MQTMPQAIIAGMKQIRVSGDPMKKQTKQQTKAIICVVLKGDVSKQSDFWELCEFDDIGW